MILIKTGFLVKTHYFSKKTTKNKINMAGFTYKKQLSHYCSYLNNAFCRFFYYINFGFIILFKIFDFEYN